MISSQLEHNLNPDRLNLNSRLFSDQPKDRGRKIKAISSPQAVQQCQINLQLLMNSYFKYLQEAKEKKIGIQGSCAQGELLKINVINDVQVLVELSSIRGTQNGKCLYSMAMLLGILDRGIF